MSSQSLKKSSLLLAVGIFTSTLNQGLCEAPASQAEENHSCFSKVQPNIEAKAGYFFFTDSTMRDVYDQGGIDVQLSGSYPLWKGLQVYGCVEYLEKSGKSLNGNQKTSIWELPLSLGLKPVFTLHSGIQYYFTLGPRYFFVYQTNQSSYVSHHVNNNGIGLFANTGFNFIFLKHLLIDVFGEYSYANLSFHSSVSNSQGNSVDVGGFTFGGGLGYAF